MPAVLIYKYNVFFLFFKCNVILMCPFSSCQVYDDIYLEDRKWSRELFLLKHIKAFTNLVYCCGLKMYSLGNNGDRTFYSVYL